MQKEILEQLPTDNEKLSIDTARQRMSLLAESALMNDCTSTSSCSSVCLLEPESSDSQEGLLDLFSRLRRYFSDSKKSNRDGQKFRWKFKRRTEMAKHLGGNFIHKETEHLSRLQYSIYDTNLGEFKYCVVG